MTDFIYVDNSNFFIEGARISAVSRGLVPSLDEALSSRIIDQSYRIDFHKLYRLLVADTAAGDTRARIFGSRNLSNGDVWEEAARAGFEVIVHDRIPGGREKKVDTSLVLAMARDAYRNGRSTDRFIIVSGDNDYCPAISQLRQDGFNVEVLFWSHAGRQIKHAANRFIPLDEHVNALRA